MIDFLKEVIDNAKKTSESIITTLEQIAYPERTVDSDIQRENDRLDLLDELDHLKEQISLYELAVKSLLDGEVRKTIKLPKEKVQAYGKWSVSVDKTRDYDGSVTVYLDQWND